MFRTLYTLLIYLFSPLALFLLYRPRKGKKGYAERWKEHLGYIPKLKAREPLWLHAVSVGEVVAATPVIRELKQRHPELPILLTTTTRTGAEQAASLADLVEHRYAPLDFPGAIRRFLNKTSPRALLIMETELWPNLLAQCHKRNIPALVLNARLSDRTCRRYRRFLGLFKGMQRNLKKILCQHKPDADNFRALGVPDSKISITGSVKFDINYPAELIEKAHSFRKTLGCKRPIWIAASTHKGRMSSS